MQGENRNQMLQQTVCVSVSEFILEILLTKIQENFWMQKIAQEREI